MIMHEPVRRAKCTASGTAFAYKLRDLVRAQFPQVDTDGEQNGEVIGLLLDMTVRVAIARGVEVGCSPEDVFSGLIDALQLTVQMLLDEIANGAYTRQ